MTKKIAIQLFGHMRTFEYCFEYFQKNIVESLKKDTYDIDIFIHTWDEEDHSTANWRGLENNNTKIKLSSSSIEKIKKYYNPKDILITPQQDIEEYIITENIGHCKRSIKGCYNMAYSLYKGSEIRRKYAKENNIKYDWVIITRPDVLFKNPFSMDKMLDFYYKFNFKIPENGLFYAYNPFRSSSCNIEDSRILAGSDLFYFAKPENIDKATSLFENFYENIDINDFYCMEVWWMTYFKKIGLNPLKMNYIAGKDWFVLYKKDISILNKPIRNDSRKKIYLFGIPFFKLIYKNQKIKFTFLGIPIIKIK